MPEHTLCGCTARLVGPDQVTSRRGTRALDEPRTGRTNQEPTPPRRGGVRSLWRLRSYLRPYVAALGADVRYCRDRRLRRAGDPARDQGDHRRTDHRSGGRPDPAAGAAGPRAGDHRGRPDPDPALGPGPCGARLRDRDPQRPLSTHAGAADGVSRPLAERPAAVAGDRRPERDPALHGLRAAVPGHQHLAGHRRDGGPAAHVLAAGAGGRLGRHPDDLAVEAVRVALRAGVASGARRARRRRDRGRGGRAGLPRGEVVRSQPLQQRQLPPAPPPRSTTRRCRRFGSRRASGPSSR